MNLLDDLATQALIGVERRPPALPAAPGALGELLNAIAATTPDPAGRVLRAAGAIGLCALAGWQPAVSDSPSLIPCPPETRPVPGDDALLAVLGQVLDEGPDRLRAEALHRLVQAGYRLPPRLLPRLLALGQKNPDLRPFIFPAMGPRGRWLASLNPDWRDLAGDAISISPAPRAGEGQGGGVGGSDLVPTMELWQTGTLEQRRQFLLRGRTVDPARTRALLDEALSELNARERAELLETLRTGLSADDEDFIEQRLRDRGKDVRQVAASLLASLPDSRYVGRMAARLAPCIRQERRWLRQTLVIDPPEEFGADWKNDAIDDARPSGGALGERAWWLYQLARALPLAWWERQTGKSPAELLDWARDTDWSTALLWAWRDAVMRERKAAWAGALLDRLPFEGLNLAPAELIELLPLPDREARWLRLLQTGQNRPGELLALISQSLPLDSPPLSADFARRLLAMIRVHLGADQGRWDYPLRTTLPELACLIPATVFADLATGWPAAEPPAFADTVARMLAIIGQRQALIHHLPSGSPP